MRTIAVSDWIAYLPFWECRPALGDLGIDLLTGVHDQEDGIAEKRYAAAPMSLYALAEAFPRLRDSIGVAWIAVEPTGQASDRIICRPGIESVVELHGRKVGVVPLSPEHSLFEHVFDSVGLPIKTDYVFLQHHSACISAFDAGMVDAIVVHQPERSRLIKSNGEADVLPANRGLPAYGLCAPFVYRKSQFSLDDLDALHVLLTRAARSLESLGDEELKLFAPLRHLGRPKKMLEAIRWPSKEKSDQYLTSTATNSFSEHMRKISELQARRFFTFWKIGEEELDNLLTSPGYSARNDKLISERASTLGQLDPVKLHKPLDPSPGALEAMQACRAFHQLTRFPSQAAYDDFHVRWLAAKYRILEWEIFIRDRVATGDDDPLNCDFATRRKGISAVLPRVLRKELIDSINRVTGKSDENANKEVERDLASFNEIEPKHIKAPYPEVHRDLFRLFLSGSRQRQQSGLLIEDGELTFLSLLWLCRRVGRAALDEAVRDPSSILKGRFEAKEGIPVWGHTTLPEMLEQCGVAVRTDGRLRPMPRWFSLCAWLQRTATAVRMDGQAALPIKGDKTRTGRVERVAKASADQFAEELERGFKALSEGVCQSLHSGPETLSDFSKQLVPWLLDPFKGLIQDAPGDFGAAPGEDESGSWIGQDHCLFQQARLSFFPWEFLLRTWQPIPVHLLILPLGASALRTHFALPENVRGSTDNGIEEVPHSLAYVTIAGKAPDPRADPAYDLWLASYWALYEGLANEWMIEQIEGDWQLEVRNTRLESRAALAEELSDVFYSVVDGHHYLTTLNRAVVKAADLIDPIGEPYIPLKLAADLAKPMFLKRPRMHDVWQFFEGDRLVDKGFTLDELGRWVFDLKGVELRESDRYSGPLFLGMRRAAEGYLTLGDEESIASALVLAKAVSKLSIPCSFLECDCTNREAVMLMPKRRGVEGETSGDDDKKKRTTYPHDLTTALHALIEQMTEGIGASIVRDRAGDHRVVLSEVVDWRTIEERSRLLFERTVSVEDSGGWPTCRLIARLTRGLDGRMWPEVMNTWTVEPERIVWAPVTAYPIYSRGR